FDDDELDIEDVDNDEHKAEDIEDDDGIEDIEDEDGIEDDDGIEDIEDDVHLDCYFLVFHEGLSYCGLLLTHVDPEFQSQAFLLGCFPYEMENK
ncbi:unnamed protein product, partial [Rotaria sp. Silwood2]